jgi:hypothetical protein
VVLRFMVPPFGLSDDRGGAGRPAGCHAGLTTSRRGSRSGLTAVLPCCVHDATFTQRAERALKRR